MMLIIPTETRVYSESSRVDSKQSTTTRGPHRTMQKCEYDFVVLYGTKSENKNVPALVYISYEEHLFI